MNRRDFIARTAVFTGATIAPSLFAASATRRAPRILVRGSWQSVNIGDISHKPGALRLIERHFLEAEVTLWPGELGADSVIQCLP